MKILKKLIFTPHRAVIKLGYIALSLVGHTDYTPFIILSRSRTGSNLLRYALQSHPNIYSAGEIFMHLNGRDYRTVLNRIFSRHPRFIRAVGFKLFYYHPHDVEDPGIQQTLIEKSRLHVIHLKRRNILRSAISRKIATNNQIWVTRKTRDVLPAKAKRVSFTPEEIESEIDNTLQEIGQGDTRFGDKPMLTVYYEDLVADHEAIFREITSFLGLPYAKPRLTLKKQNPEPMSELVENFDELKAHFKGHRLEHYFE